MYHGILQLCAFVHAFLFLDYSIPYHSPPQKILLLEILILVF